MEEEILSAEEMFLNTFLSRAPLLSRADPFKQF